MKRIRSRAEYVAALAAVEKLMDGDPAAESDAGRNLSRLTATVQAYENRLSPRAKAEILAGVLHRIEHMPKILRQLPRSYRRQIHQALIDCSIWHKDLTPEDYREVRAWFTGYRPTVRHTLAQLLAIKQTERLALKNARKATAKMRATRLP